MNLKDEGLRSGSKMASIWNRDGFLFLDLERDRDDLECCYLEGLVLENCWGEVFH